MTTTNLNLPYEVLAWGKLFDKIGSKEREYFFGSHTYVDFSRILESDKTIITVTYNNVRISEYWDDFPSDELVTKLRLMLP